MNIKEKFVMNLPSFDAALSDKFTKIVNDNQIEAVGKVSAEEFERAQKCIEIYDEVYKQIPYPFLYSESNIKYCAIAEVMRQKYEVTERMQLENGLMIQLNNEVALRIVRGKAAFIEHKLNENEETLIDIEEFENNVQYEWFSAFIEKIVAGKDAYEVYDERITDVYKALRSDKEYFVSNFEKFLYFEGIPKCKQAGSHQIIDLTNGSRYYMAVYPSGDIEEENEEDEDREVLVFKRDKAIRKKFRNIVKEYDYRVEQIALDEEERLLQSVNADEDKRYRIDKCAEYIYGEMLKNITSIYSDEGVEYCGYVAGKLAVIHVGRKVFVCRLDKYAEPKLVTGGENIEIISMTNEFVYVLDKIETVGGTMKYIYYKFNLFTNNKTLCCIKYRSKQA